MADALAPQTCTLLLLMLDEPERNVLRAVLDGPIMEADIGPSEPQVRRLTELGLLQWRPTGGVHSLLGRDVTQLDARVRELAGKLASLPGAAIASIAENPVFALMCGRGTMDLSGRKATDMVYGIATPTWRSEKAMFGGQRWSPDGPTIAVIGSEDDCRTMCILVARELSELDARARRIASQLSPRVVAVVTSWDEDGDWEGARLSGLVEIEPGEEETGCHRQTPLGQMVARVLAEGTKP